MNSSEKKLKKLTSALENHLSLCHENVETTCGPLWYKQYYTWTARSKSQFTNDRIKRILEKYPQSTPSILTPDQGPVLIMVHGLTSSWSTDSPQVSDLSWHVSPRPLEFSWNPRKVTRAKYDVEQQYGLKVTEGDVDDVWQVIYSTRWISSLKNRATDCKSCFQKYKNGKITEKRSRLKCEDVVLWWRMNKAVEITGSG